MAAWVNRPMGDRAVAARFAVLLAFARVEAASAILSIFGGVGPIVRTFGLATRLGARDLLRFPFFAIRQISFPILQVLPDGPRILRHFYSRSVFRRTPLVVGGR